MLSSTHGVGTRKTDYLHTTFRAFGLGGVSRAPFNKGAFDIRQGAAEGRTLDRRRRTLGRIG